MATIAATVMLRPRWRATRATAARATPGPGVEVIRAAEVATAEAAGAVATVVEVAVAAEAPRGRCPWAGPQPTRTVEEG